MSVTLHLMHYASCPLVASEPAIASCCVGSLVVEVLMVVRALCPGRHAILAPSLCQGHKKLVHWSIGLLQDSLPT